MFKWDHNAASRHTPASPVWEEPAGLHHTGVLFIFSQSISALDHLLLSPGHSSLLALLPALLGHPMCQHWHCAVSPRCAVVVHNISHYKCFNIHTVLPPLPTRFFLHVEMSFHLLHHILGRTGRMELKVSN